MSNDTTFNETDANLEQVSDGEQQFVSFLVEQERFASRPTANDGVSKPTGKCASSL